MSSSTTISKDSAAAACNNNSSSLTSGISASIAPVVFSVPDSCDETSSSIMTSAPTTNEPPTAVRRQTSLGDYFPAELAVRSSISSQQQQQQHGKRRQQQPPRHRVTRPASSAAVAVANDDSGYGDVGDIEERRLRDCLALAFTSSPRQQQQQQQQPHSVASASTSVAPQLFNDPFGLAKLADQVDKDVGVVNANDGPLNQSSSTNSSRSSSSPSTSVSIGRTSLSDEDEQPVDDGNSQRLGADLAAGAAVYSVGGVALSTFGVGESTEDDDRLFLAAGANSLFESSMFSAAGSPSDRPLHQHRFADGALRRRTGGGSHQGGNDDRELFVGNLAAEVTNEDLVRIFSEFGPLKSVGIAKDSTSGACKGFGFLCFQQPELAETVLESPRLFTLYGRVLRVDWRLKNPGHHGNHANRRLSSSSGCIGSPRHYNYQQVQLGANLTNADDASVLPSVDDDEAANGGCGLNGDCQLFVGNLASDVTQGDLRQYFRRWGELLYCYVIRDEDGQSKRYGFITFKDPKVAEQLMQSRSSHVLKGKRLRFEMPKRSREEAFSLRQQDASSSSATSTPKTSPGAPTTPVSTKLSQQQVVSPEQKQSVPAGLEQSSSDQLPLWLHLRLMSDKEQLILCLRKELGLCGLLAERRMREISQARDQEAQLMRVYVQQLEAQVKAQTAELETLRHQLECRGEQVKLLTAKTEALAVEIVKAWGCAAATAAASTNGRGKEDCGASAAAGPGAVAVSASQQQQKQPQQQQQPPMFHHQHRLRPDSGIGL
ncbi:hypothetical protein BOX15_Mlig005226g1 [Macrostomum lignano]|uniref:RRM domain-containing protein n=1 Tax=Macrostomum lignano TaxID=282301 RepID=A0A267GZ52_9PLAT|nr:hypothetical protein BOX15_Mlig005226g1 [Macrostomum lignano]